MASSLIQQQLRVVARRSSSFSASTSPSSVSSSSATAFSPSSAATLTSASPFTPAPAASSSSRRRASTSASPPASPAAHPALQHMKRATLGPRANSLIFTRFQHGAAKARSAIADSATAPRRLSSAMTTSSSSSARTPQPLSATPAAAAAAAEQAPPQPPPPPPPPPRQPAQKPPTESSAASSASATESTAKQASSAAAAENQKHSHTAAAADAVASASTWFRRTIYLTAGAGAAAGAAAYFYNPAPFHATAQSVYEDMDARVRFFTEPSREKLLPDMPAPPGGAAAAAAPRTLVVDLDRTLVHSTYSRQSGWRVAKRPGAEAFLAYLASFYEIVVFTSNLNTYADPILDRLDPNMYVQHRLYRGETLYRGGVHLKDLSRLNRDGARVVVIDHDPRVVALQPDNAVLVPEWTGDPADTALLDLIPVLEALVREDVADVREVLHVMRDKPVAEGVAAFHATAPTRADKSRSPSLFGHQQQQQQAAAGANAQQQQSADGKDGEGDAEAAGGKGVWGALGGGRSRLLGQGAAR